MKKQLNLKRLYNIALFYLSKYEASCKQVEDMLNRRILKAKLNEIDVPLDVDEMVSQVINQLIKQNYLSDERFAENRARHWAEQGKSNTAIALKLKQAGISNELIQTVLENDEYSEFDKARQYVIRRRLGFMRPDSQRSEMHQKDLAKLARQGFSFDVAVRALDSEDSENQN